MRQICAELANLKDRPRNTDTSDLYDKDLRQQFLPDAKGNKNPDYRIDSKLFDLKTFQTISRNINNTECNKVGTPAM